jgi:hypothetical protein
MQTGFKTATQEAHVNGDALPGDPLDRDTENAQRAAAYKLAKVIETGDLAEIEHFARHFVNLRGLGRSRSRRLDRIQKAA